VLGAARRQLPQRALVRQALDELQWLATHLRRSYPGLRIGFDLSDMSGYAYYSGPRFASTPPPAATRWRVAAATTRSGPSSAATGRRSVSASTSRPWPRRQAVRRPDGDPRPLGRGAELRAAVRRLREAGETVLAVLPGHEPEVSAFDCDRELVAVAGRWVLRSIAAVPATNS